MTFHILVDTGNCPQVSQPILRGTLSIAAIESAGSSPQSRFPIGRGLPPRTHQRVRDYVEANLESDISLQVLADITGLSLSHFARAFKQSEGVPPHEYLIRCRVRRVQELLVATDLPLSEIARACGFADQSHCMRRFRERVGINPSSYRLSKRDGRPESQKR